MEPFSLKWKISEKHDGISIKEYLLKVEGLSRRSLTAIKFKGGYIHLNGKPVTVRFLIKQGDMLEVYFPAEPRSEKILAEDLPLDIVYEDDHILIISKPANMATIPSKDHVTGTLANAILYYYDLKGLNYTVHVVNRLDRDTSGLMIIAKHSYAHHLLSEQHREGKIKRQYEAIVHGNFEEDEGTIDAPIGRKDTSIIEREVRDDGQRAITHYKVKKRLKTKSWLSLYLETGRTHQIRVHLSSTGHPLLGDDLYGGATSEITRQALHCCELIFFHPLLKKQMRFEKELPRDIKEVLEKG